MSVIQREVTVAAGVTNPNLIAGSAFEFARNNMLLSIGVVCDTALCFFNINSGADIVVEESPAVVLARFPVIPDEMYYSDVAAQGDRIVIGARNPTAGAVVFRVIVQGAAI